MITVLSGENSFEVHQALHAIVRGFEGAAEKIDGSEIDLKQIPDLLMGGTLFASRRLVIIKNLSENKTVWPNFAEWLPRVSDDIHLVLVEPKLDKRTKTYKDLQKIAKVTEFSAWTERDTAKAEQWVAGEARALDIDIDNASVRLLVQRIGPDQWLLHHALQKIAVLDQITPEVIQEIIDINPVENVFELFEAALKGDARKIRRMIETLEVTEDPYRLFGLLSGQAFQLAALAVAGDKTTAEVAKDLGVHPYGLGRLSSYANRRGKAGVRNVIAAFAEADTGMKTSVAEPWLLIERALIKVCNL